MSDVRRKRILMLARHNQAEALRMAAGLTLLDDVVKVDVVGRLAQSGAVAEQQEALEFAEVPVAEVDLSSDDDITRVARDILESDVVFVV